MAEPNYTTPVIAKPAEEQVVCKLFKTGTEKRSATLVSANPEHLDGTPTVVDASAINHILGPVVRVIHDL